MKYFKKFFSKKFFYFGLILLLILVLEFVLYQNLQIFSPSRNILLFFLLQINFLILLLLLFFIFRYLWKTFWDLKGGRGSKSLKIKLFLLYFLSLSFPALVLSGGSYIFLKKSLDLWFKDILSQKILGHYLNREDLIKEVEEDLLKKALKIKSEYIEKTENIQSKVLRERFRYFWGVDSIEVFTLEGILFKRTYSDKIEERPGIPPSIIEELLKEKGPQSQIQTYGSSLLVRIFVLANNAQRKSYILAVGKVVNPKNLGFIPNSQKDLAQSINLFVFLSFLLIILLILFLGIWVGHKFGKSLSEPLQSLILATQKISQRNFDLSELKALSSSEDEIGILIQSFTKMAEEIKIYQETLKKYNQNLVNLFNLLPVGLIIFKRNSEIFFQNSTFQQILENFGSIELKKWTQSLSLEHYFQNLNYREPFYKIYTWERDNKVIPLGITFMKLDPWEEDLLLLIVENLEEKELLKQLSLWREVAIKLAHEIKNPLTPIKLSIERLKKKLSSDIPLEKQEFFENTVNLILKYIEELKNLTQQLYSFSKKRETEKVWIDLRENIQETLWLYQAAYPSLKISFTWNEKGEYKLWVDPFHLKRVWINLIENSIKAMEGKGEIAFQLEEEDQKIKVFYRDSGPGLKEELIQALNHGDLSILQKVGTGLFIIYTSLTLCKGTLKVQNHPIKGTEFILEFLKNPK